ncbi:nuclear transport factor 2 family protein [Nonomuraea sp. NPDC050310]|uniref:YybH family protein n=1 Tax=Nonomuraea sp. NPDC050310 TaxID=3154935 RepID=UPI0033F7F24D
MSAEQTLQAHLAALTARDLAAFTATLHEEVVVVLPNGSRLEGRQAVTDFHRDWFADLDWTQELTPLSVIETAGTLVATYEADYCDVDAQGAPIHARNVLSLVFTHGPDGWSLLHDQNTRLP